ncbi:MAG TPA: DNA polymerase III subunit alpha, partial [Porticoccaceae bacterium]|nr:DNA polymerase III subunit alpha [Porticoccaceae bacterium]
APQLPAYPVPEGQSTEDFFRNSAREGLEKRFATRGIAAQHRREDYVARLERELDIINQMGFPGYFLIVMDFIRWARENDIPVGPGRGSGAGSLVAYALEITDLDPLEYDLLFERFLNPE